MMRAKFTQADQVAIPGARAWRLVFDCEGAPFVWTGHALTERDAINQARGDIYRHGIHNQDTARVIECSQVGA